MSEELSKASSVDAAAWKDTRHGSKHMGDLFTGVRQDDLKPSNLGRVNSETAESVVSVPTETAGIKPGPRSQMQT